jgi:diguanylate cyclase (GGDEF)-like protein
MTLDIPTIFVLLVLNNLLTAALLAVSFRGRRTPATNLWAASLLVQTLAWALFAARGKAPDLISVALATSMFSLGLAMLTEAFCRFFEFPAKRYWIYFPPLLTLAVVWWNMDNLANRNITVGLISSVQFLAAAVMILTRNDKWRALRTFISITAIVMAIMFFARAAIAFHDPTSIPALNVTSPFQTASFLIGDAARLAFSFGFLLLIEARRSDELTRLAALDPLTEAYNRRTFIELAERELARARRYRQPMGLMFLDLDHFKMINDNHGHLAGDEVLRQIKKVAESCLRQQDVFGRYGGEEFCVLVPDTDLAGTQVIAERLRQGIENSAPHLPGGKPLRITASIGVSAIPAGLDAINFDNLIEYADLALYQAKKQGRNRVVAEDMAEPVIAAA